jgi:subtilisin family serine protease
MAIINKLICIFLLLNTLLLIFASGRVHLMHHTVELDEPDNLKHRLLSSQMGEEQKHMQVMIHCRYEEQVAMVREYLGQDHLHHVIPPQTIVVHEDVSILSRKVKQLSQEVQDAIEWIGHVKPHYKSTLLSSSVDVVNDVQVELIVKLVHRNEPMAKQLTTTLSSHFSSSQRSLENNHNTKVFVSSNNVLRVYTLASEMKSVVEHIARQEEVLWIERRKPVSVLNYAVNQIVQSNGASTADTLTGEHAIWSKGITGEGEVIAIADTGIDYDMCFFRDTQKQVPFQTLDTSHRKIVGYELSSSIDKDGNKIHSLKGDEPDGHGTHVSGTVAGNVLSSATDAESLSKMNGVAKDAKIHFTDIGTTGTLLIPDDLNQLFSIAYDKSSARIHSNSWGCALSNIVSCSYDCECAWVSNGEEAQDSDCMSMYGTKCCQICSRYDSWAHDVDHFTHENDDMLILFSAGNSGSVSADTSIGSPSTAKNSLSVGASRTFNQEYLTSVDYRDLTDMLDFFQISTVDECCNAGDFAKPFCCPTTIKQMYENHTDYYNKNNMVSFSSRGPIVDGRVKPDVVAPGSYVISAYSDGDLNSNNCGSGGPARNNSAALTTKQGTSMAAPATAGAAGLIRQYYRTKQSISNPSGMLIKATIIHSAAVMKGIVDLDGEMNSRIIQLPQNNNAPNIYNGYGIVSLSSALAFDDSSFKLVVDDRASLRQSKHKLYCFQSSSDDKTSLKATLTWYDPPAIPNAKHVLVNNLDLDIEELVSDDIKNTTEVKRVRGNGGTTNDDVNNSEKAWMLDIPPNTIVAVRVHATRVVSRSQSYALVITHSNSIVQIEDDNCQFAATVSSASTHHPTTVLLLLLLLVSLLL